MGTSIGIVLCIWNMGKYDPLRDFLSARSESEWKATFPQIEKVLGFRLPQSAYKYAAWWANNDQPHVQASAWLQAGWQTAEINLRNETLTFRRVGTSRTAPSDSGKASQPDSVPTNNIRQPDRLRNRRQSSVSNKKAVALVSCAKQKGSVPSQARDLYTSALFAKSRAYVEAIGCKWYILSALHGLVDPAETIEPYDKTLLDMTRTERQDWSRKVMNDLEDRATKGQRIILLAGKRYSEFLIPMLKERGYVVEEPLAGLGIGRRLAALSVMTRQITRTQI